MRIVLSLCLCICSFMVAALNINSEFSQQKHLPYSYTLDDSNNLKQLLDKQIT
jgi:hypothetical protein